MSVLCSLLLRVTMTDALPILGVKDKAGKDQPFALSSNRELGTGRMAPELWSTLLHVPSPPFLLPRILFPLYLQEITHYRGKIYLLHRRLSFTLWDLLCNECGSSSSPVKMLPAGTGT